MAATAGSIDYKVNKFLFSRHGAMTFRQCQNHLVQQGILSDDEADVHHDHIRSLYLAWKAGFDADHSGNQQPQSVQPATPESLAPHATSSKISTSSSLESARDDLDSDGLKEAVEKLDPEWPLPGPVFTSVLVPGGLDPDPVVVNRHETLCAQSYIKALTLKRNGIKCEERTINLRWQSYFIAGRDKCVQHTCFIVVSEDLADEAGFDFDMLVGANHGLPLREQMRALGAEETGLAGSSIIDQTDDLPANSFGVSCSAEPHPRNGMYVEAYLFCGSSDGVADCIKKVRASGDGKSKAASNPAGHFIRVRDSASEKRKASFSEDLGGPSRRLCLARR